MKKQLIAFSVLACASSLALCACGKNNGNNNEEMPAIIDDLERDENGKFDVNLLDNVQLNLWSVIGQPDQVVLENQVKEFNKQFAGLIEIKLKSVGHYDYYNALSYAPATEVISFTFNNEYFYITACNAAKIYNYSIDRTSISTDPLGYFLVHDVTSTMMEVLDSYNKGDIPSGYTSKYLTSDDMKNHTVSYTSGGKTYITSTIYDSINKKVSVIYKVDIDTLLDNSYIPTQIGNSHQTLYSLYRYIATR